MANVETAPSAAARETIARLRDAGIRVLGVCDGEAPGVPCSFAVSRVAASRQLLRNWKKGANLKRVSFITLRGSRSASEEHMLASLLEEEGWEFSFIPLPSDQPASLLDALSKPEESGVLLPAGAATFLSFRAPDILTSLLRTYRVAFVDGPVTLPFSAFPEDARVDLISVDWSKVTRAISEKMATADDEEANPVIFEAEARLRVSARECARMF